MARTVNSEKTTTITIPQALADKIDKLIEGVLPYRKDFVEYAYNYFERTGFDIKGDVAGVSILEEFRQQLQQQSIVYDQIIANSEIVKTIAERVHDSQHYLLPPNALALAEIDKRTDTERELARTQAELDRVRKELKRVKSNLRRFAKDIDDSL